MDLVSLAADLAPVTILSCSRMIMRRSWDRDKQSRHGFTAIKGMVD